MNAKGRESHGCNRLLHKPPAGRHRSRRHRLRHHRRPDCPPPCPRRHAHPLPQPRPRRLPSSFPFINHAASRPPVGGNTHAWSSATIIGLFCGAGVLCLVFVTWERRKGADALIPTPVVRNRVVVAACVVAMSIMGTTILASYWMPIYFQTVRGKSPLTSGVNMLPNIIPSVVFGILTGFLSKCPS